MEIRRISMNTSLKNARIFDDDSWDEITAGLIKNQCDASGSSSRSPSKIEQTPIEIKPNIMNTENSSFSICKDTYNCSKIEITPKKELIEVKQEFDHDEDSNFPISKEAFANFTFKTEIFEQLTSPMKTELIDDNDSNSRKSLKCSKLNSFMRKRDSPYKKPENIEKRTLTSVPFNIDEDDHKIDRKADIGMTRRRSRQQMETDPDILARRQKQIDYGKNTVGYDIYNKTVPMSERKPDDPQTPKKNIKYSRRAWDGLIKQWRLRLHKYDPE